MAREHFFHDENWQHLKLLDQAARQSGLSRGEIFSDFLTMPVAALSGGSMEAEYLQTVARHTDGKPGRRSCDTIAQLFASVITAMEHDCREGMKDILGDLFEGGISYGEHGIYFTPPPVARLMAGLTVNGLADASEQDDGPKTVCDPACGSGRMLLAVAELHPTWEFVGADVDARCAKIATLNLALRGIYGYILHGNSLTLETWRVYRTGFNGRGFIRDVPPAECPYSLGPTAPPTDTISSSPPAAAPLQVIPHRESEGDDRLKRQRTLF